MFKYIPTLHISHVTREEIQSEETKITMLNHLDCIANCSHKQNQEIILMLF